MEKSKIELTEWVMDFINKITDLIDVRTIKDRLEMLTLNGFSAAIKTNDLELVKKHRTLNMYEYKIHAFVEYRFLGKLKNNIYTPVVVFIKKDRRIRDRYIELAAKRIKNY